MNTKFIKAATISTLLLGSTQVLAGSYVNTELWHQSGSNRVKVEVDGDKIKVSEVTVQCGQVASATDTRNLKDGDTGVFYYTGARNACDTPKTQAYNVYVTMEVKLKYTTNGYTYWHSCGDFEMQTFTYAPYYGYNNDFVVYLDGSKSCGNIAFDFTREQLY